MRSLARSGTLSLVYGRAIAALIASLLVSLPTAAVIIDSDPGTGNTTAPPDDPGWDHVGVSNGLSVVYLRNGWVLTAEHVGSGDVTLAGVVYTLVPGTETQLDNGNDTFADLMVFGIMPTPPLPDLEIRSDSSLPTGEVIMIGNGRSRGAASDSDDPGIWTPAGEPSPSVKGWYWSAPATPRWGTNEIADFYWCPECIDTESFYTVFDNVGDSGHTEHEAQASSGDSGGALFAKAGGDWELAGVMWAVITYIGQNENTSALRGNVTLAADLSFYRDDIMTLTATTPVPEPALVLQLITGAGFLSWVQRRRSRDLRGAARSWRKTA